MADATVLVADDERELADLYADWLRDEYETRVAYSGAEALERFDDDVDVALLDRRMPGTSGDEVLAALRERGYDVKVAMLTAVEPGFDILEMGFDDYVVKPVYREEFTKLVSSLLRRRSYDDQVQQCFSLASKVAALQTHKSEAALADSREYAELRAQLADLEDEIDRTLSGMAQDDFVAAFHDISDEVGEV